MQVFTSNSHLQGALDHYRLESKSIGFVPTMGAIHQGHLSLIKKALATCDRVVASIFINPRQFNNAIDLARYPRTIERDIDLLKGAGCHYLYNPNEAEVFKNEESISWDFGELMRVMEGEYRPGHFEGMLSVVHQLLLIIQPNDLFMGEKDFQQAALVRQLLNMRHKNIRFHLVGTVREPDGLAMSSRNALLSPEDRVLARLIPSALMQLVATPDIATCVSAIDRFSQSLSASGIKIDYLQLRRDADLGEMKPGDLGHGRVFFAGHVGRVRLIDNLARN